MRHDSNKSEKKVTLTMEERVLLEVRACAPRPRKTPLTRRQREEREMAAFAEQAFDVAFKGYDVEPMNREYGDRIEASHEVAKAKHEAYVARKNRKRRAKA